MGRNSGIPQAAGGRERGLADPRVAIPEQHRKPIRVLRRGVAERHGREMALRRVSRTGQDVDPRPVGS